MDVDLPIPKQRLSKNSIKAMLISELIGNAIWLPILAVFFYLDARFNWWEWVGWVLWVVLGVTVLSMIYSLTIQPFLLYKNFRYEVDEEFLQIKRGVFVENYELIPMTKIQSVATNQGPVQRRYSLYGLSVETMSSAHTIPMLSKEVALQLRNTIAYYAKIKEVDE